MFPFVGLPECATEELAADATPAEGVVAAEGVRVPMTIGLDTAEPWFLKFDTADA